MCLTTIERSREYDDRPGNTVTKESPTQRSQILVKLFGNEVRDATGEVQGQIRVSSNGGRRLDR